LLTGAIYSRLTKRENPFITGNTTKLYSSFGVDNTVPFLVGVTGCAIGQDTFRPFDKVTINYFLKLEGKKFSTSRGHIIWAGDIAKKTPANTDLIRLYLISLRLHQEESDFLINDFIQFHNTWSMDLAKALEIPNKSKRKTPSPELLKNFTNTATILRTALHANVPDYETYIDKMKEWITVPVENRDYWWLKMWSWISWPVLPEYAMTIWKQLGEDNTPNLETLFHSPIDLEITSIQWDNPKVLVFSDLEDCLPETLEPENAI
jgi:methionyl-tRNA synthetase